MIINTYLREKLFLNYWIVPVLVVLLFGILSIYTLYLDTFIYELWLSDSAVFIHKDSAQAVLSTIAASVITVTSVVFSITVLILSIASNQLGPRLIPNFIKQGTTQFVIGLFIGTFVFCICILSTINPSTPIPHLSIILSMILGISCFLILIYFIHYICRSIQVEYVLENILKEFKQLINVELESQKLKYNTYENSYNKNNLPKLKKQVISEEHGYLQNIDLDQLLSICDKNNITVELLVQSGNFLKSNIVMFYIYHEESLPENISQDLLKCFRIGSQRSTTQDIEFIFEQMAEIGIRALSPSLNNPYTAILCLDFIAESLILLAQTDLPPTILMSKKQSSGLILSRTNHKEIIKKAFDRFRQQAVNDLSVSIKFMQIIEEVIKCSQNQYIKKYLLTHAKLLYEAQESKIKNSTDLSDLKKSLNKINKSLNTKDVTTV
tara:strand:- start:69326 stop:70639 length:1314 start_codon:yes stop_codon:yes gene_type:complete